MKSNGNKSPTKPVAPAKPSKSNPPKPPPPPEAPPAGSTVTIVDQRPDAVWTVVSHPDGFWQAHGILFPSASGKPLSALGLRPAENNTGSAMLRIEIGTGVAVLSSSGAPVQEKVRGQKIDLVVSGSLKQRMIELAITGPGPSFPQILRFAPQVVKVTVCRPGRGDVCDEPTCRLYNDGVVS